MAAPIENRFLRLPIELQELICGFALCLPPVMPTNGPRDVVYAHPLMAGGGGISAAHVLREEPAVLQAFPHLRAKMLSSYYGQRQFVFFARSNRQGFMSWLRNIGRDGSAALRHTDFRGFMKVNHNFARHSKRVLFKLIINLYPMERNGPRYIVEASVLEPLHFPQDLSSINSKLWAIRGAVETYVAAVMGTETGLIEGDYVAIWDIIRKEALKLYYGKQAFLVMTTAKCYRRSFKLWLRKIGKSGRAALRHTVYRGFMSLGVSFDRPPGFYDRPGSVLNIYVEISIRLAQKKTDPRYRVEAYPAAFYFPEELEKLNVWVEEMRVEVEKQIEAFIAEKDVLEERDYIRLWRTIAELPDMSNELDEFDEFYHENGEPRQGGSDESEDSNGSDGSEPFVDSDAFNGSEKSDESYKPGPFDESDIPDSSEDSESDAAYEDYESGTSSEDPEFQFDDGTAYWSLARYPSTSQRERLSQEHEARRLLLGSQSQAHNWSDEWEPSDMEAFLFGDDGADSYVSSSSDELYDDV
ncbi:hypothetical protein H2201_004009 [Coniosporium apollinis]|uniref:Uncharacterized protein n=2 Tax=Coniosporium TaxID=2810619 RepID=A0ABQ9NU25_9PEZI|nr:hypothetical protein H2199_005492 [Cladosporium sp. JES 115]KAJ9665885.1 hypothetical protein H2201_004009 [Coniosporium apollinis]